jgi:hypothetical protein
MPVRCSIQSTTNLLASWAWVVILPIMGPSSLLLYTT